MGIKNKNNEYLVDILNFAADTCPDVLIDNVEDIYRAQIFHAVLSSGRKQMILLAGPSGSGKTTTARKIKEAMRHIHRTAVVVSMDDFYKNRTELPIIDGKPNAEVVESLEIELVRKVMNDILATGKASMPQFDFISGVRTDNAYSLDLGADGVLILEGIHGLNPIISDGIDSSLIHKVYVSPHSGFCDGKNTVLSKFDLRFLRRMIRDSWSRGINAEGTFAVWDDVRKSEDLYIRPLGATADNTVDTTHAYEPMAFKHHALELLGTVSQNSPFSEKARELEKALSKFREISGFMIPTESMLNEFVQL